MIIGAGFTGVELAKRLDEQQNKVTLIDNDPEIIEHISCRIDGNVVLADGNNLQNLEDAGLSKIDALVAVTSSDEINMITCSLVDSVYPDILKIARVRNYSYYTNTSNATLKHAEAFSNKKRPLYGIDYMVHPDVEAANAIVNAVNHGAISDILSFGSNDDFELAALQIEKGSKLDGLALKDIRTVTDKKIIFAFRETKNSDNDAMTSSLPSGNTILNAGDRIGFLTLRENIASVMELCGTKNDAIKKVGLVGIGKIGTLVAERIIKIEKTSLMKKIFGAKIKNQTITIIDTDKKLCKAAEQKFAEAKVLNADATDSSFINEEGINKYNLIICATHNHELNLVISAYLESLGVEKTIALVAQSEYCVIARKLGIDVPIPLRDTVIDSILSHLHGKRVQGIHTVSNGEFEIVECDIAQTSKVVGKQLKDISKPGEYLILLVKKPTSRGFELPQGNTVLSAGDHIVLIEKSGDKKIMEKFSK